MDYRNSGAQFTDIIHLYNFLCQRKAGVSDFCWVLPERAEAVYLAETRIDLTTERMTDRELLTG